MSASIKLWCFILLLPFFTAVAHDFHANYMASQENKMKLQLLQIDPKSYQGSDFGYILVKYAPDQYHFARKNLGEDKWNEWVEPVLRQYTFVVALAPALAFFLWLLFARILDIWPFSSGSRDSSGPRLNKDGTPDTSFKYKYKR